jgi:hypothetical protein
MYIVIMTQQEGSLKCATCSLLSGCHANYSIFSTAMSVLGHRHLAPHVILPRSPPMWRSTSCTSPHLLRSAHLLFHPSEYSK